MSLPLAVLLCWATFSIGFVLGAAWASRRRVSPYNLGATPSAADLEAQLRMFHTNARRAAEAVYQPLPAVSDRTIVERFLRSL